MKLKHLPNGLMKLPAMRYPDRAGKQRGCEAGFGQKAGRLQAGRFTANRSKLYGSRWQKARAAFLEFNSWCVFCERQGRKVRAGVVDHVIPHKGREAVFWNTADWQPLCRNCHDTTKQAMELECVLVGTMMDEGRLRELNQAARGEAVPIAIDARTLLPADGDFDRL